MHALLTAAQDEVGKGFDLGALAVPVVAGSVAIVVAIYNTRGETAALRRLKAMNDVIEKLPENSDVRASFTAARDALAQRVAVRMVGVQGSGSGRAPLWVLAFIGSSMSAALVWTIYQFFPPGYSPFELLANMAAGALLGGLLLATIVRLLGLWIQVRRLEREATALRLSLRGEQ